MSDELPSDSESAGAEVAVTAQDRLPGDPTRAQIIDRIIRVDHAGEYGAKRIYEGQLAMLQGKPEAAVVRKMYEQELAHLKEFERLMVERRARPSALHPLWHVAGYALGAATAFLGPKAAMACTVAVEDVIEEHYARQAEALKDSGEAKLVGEIEHARAGELEHRDTALAAGAKDAAGYEALTAVVKAGSKLAIWLSERI